MHKSASSHRFLGVEPDNSKTEDQRLWLDHNLWQLCITHTIYERLQVADNSTSNDVNEGNNELQKHGKRNKCPLAPVLFIIFYKSAN